MEISFKDKVTLVTGAAGSIRAYGGTYVCRGWSFGSVGRYR